jgi:hypothetical protein
MVNMKHTDPTLWAEYCGRQGQSDRTSQQLIELDRSTPERSSGFGTSLSDFQQVPPLQRSRLATEDHVRKFHSPNRTDDAEYE